MSPLPATLPESLPAATPRSRADRHRAIAARVARAHQALRDESLLSFVSGSTVEELVDERSDVDMSVVLATLPSAAELQSLCLAAGGSLWHWTLGKPEEGGFVVSFVVDGVEVQIGYATHATLTDQLEDLLVRHQPDTPNHKLAEGVLKAEPLVGAAALARWQQRLRDFPQGLREAMAAHAFKTPTPWRAVRQIIHRDTLLWCREIQADACYRLLLALCGLNSRYFTRFQVKRVHRLAAALAIAPPDLAARIDALLSAAPATAFAELHRLEAETLALVALHLPAVDSSLARQRHALFEPG